MKQPSKHFYIKELGYPINLELLEKLHIARIDYLLIPEDGKTGFRCYLGKTKEYLDGCLISEPFTEKQKVIPLIELGKVEIPKEKLRGALYE